MKFKENSFIDGRDLDVVVVVNHDFDTGQLIDWHIESVRDTETKDLIEDEKTLELVERDMRRKDFSLN